MRLDPVADRTARGALFMAGAPPPPFFPLTIAVLALLERLPRVPRSSLIGLGLLTAAWANLHGSFVLAPILAAASAVGALAGRSRSGELKAHGAAVMVTALAPLVNPYS